MSETTSALDLTGPMPTTFAISSFPAPATTSTTPTLRTVTLDQLRTLFGTHERRRNKDGRGWSGAKYKPGTTRANKNVVEWSVYVADLDHITGDDWLEIRATLVRLGLAFFLYSTFNSTETDFRLRVVVLLTKPIPAAQYGTVWRQIDATIFGGRNDPQTKDASRMSYLPAAPGGVATVAEYLPGLALDWEKLPPVPASATRVSANAATSTGKDVGIGRQTMEFLLFGAPDGQQRGAVLRATRSLLAAGKSVEETAEKVWQGLQASEIGDPANPWTYEHALAIAEDLAGREAPPLEERPELRVGARTETNGHASGHANGTAHVEASSVTSEQVAPAVEPKSLGDVTAAFQKWLYLKDTGPVLVVLATIAANEMQGDPVWLMIVGASSGGKTEVLNAASRLDHVHLAAVLTEAALLSGTPKREKAKEAKGGLLREIGPFGILLLKDFTSILSMKHESRAGVLAALREVYDGSWTRHIGTDGGRTLHWEGKLGLIACCTTIIDAHHAVTASMGERFLLYRLPEINPKDQARQALRNAGREREMREELATAVGGLFAGIELPKWQPDLSEDETDRLVALASLAARARSAVERDGRTREIELIPDAEAPARLVQALRRLYGGLLVIGSPREEAWPLVVKVGLDCMPKLRRSIFEYLVEHDEWITTTAVATAVEYPTQTARRSLEDLMVHGLVLRTAGGKGKSDSWKLADRARQWHAEALGTVPENSLHANTPAGDGGGNTLFESAQCMEGEFSGTPPDVGEMDRNCWSCGAALLEELDDRCEVCGWLLCRCGACGCREES